jgi:hypothetical protein
MPGECNLASSVPGIRTGSTFGKYPVIKSMILETSPFLHISRSLVSEAKIPSDRDSILGSFHADVDDRKLSPTVEFLKEAF